MTNTTKAKIIPVSHGASFILYPEYASEITGWKDSCCVSFRLINATVMRWLVNDWFLLCVVLYGFKSIDDVTFPVNLSVNSIIIIRTWYSEVKKLHIHLLFYVQHPTISYKDYYYK